KCWYTVARETCARPAISATEARWNPSREITARAASRIASRRVCARGDGIVAPAVGSVDVTAETDMSVPRDLACVGLAVKYLSETSGSRREGFAADSPRARLPQPGMFGAGIAHTGWPRWQPRPATRVARL